MSEETDAGTSDGQMVGEFVVTASEDGTDTAPYFDEVFQGKNKFESWEDFIVPFETFQEVTGSVFKPRSGTCVSYVNEKRVNHKIPEKFIYQTVNMICLHYGSQKNRESPPKRKRKSKRYIGHDCGAYVKLSYKKGFLHITDKNLVHTNHPLIKTEAEVQMRKIRPVVFDDELDLMITNCAAKNRVFETRIAEKNWTTALIQLQSSDDRLSHMTKRMLKKRIQFLMDRYRSNNGGCEPLEGDEMGVLLYELMIEKEEMMSTYTPGKRGRKRKADTSARRSRPKVAAKSYEEYLERKKCKGDLSYEEDPGEDSMDQGLSEESTTHISASNSNEKSSPSKSDMTNFFHYWKERDVSERELRWQEMDLRRQEMEIRKKEMDLQRERFDHEREERMALMNLLKIQGEAITSRSSGLQLGEVQLLPEKKNVNVTKEFILLKNGTLKPLTD